MKTALKFAFVVVVAALVGVSGIYYLFPDTTAGFLIKVDRELSGLSQHSIEVDGLRIHYLAGGQGDPLVLLHGFGADKDHWTRIARHLTPHVRVIAPDLPGFGETDLPLDSDYTIRSQMARIHALIQALEIKAHHLGGSSMGGAIVGAYAAYYPNSVKSLVLFAPAGVATAEKSEMFERIAKGKAMPLIAKDAEEYEQLLDFVFVEKPFIPMPVKKVLARQAIARYPLYQKIFSTLINTSDAPLEDVLVGLPVPTLIIWGDQDRVLHVSGAKILGSAIPNAKIDIMRAVGHLPMLEKPKVSADIYLQFLGEL